MVTESPNFQALLDAMYDAATSYGSQFSGNEVLMLINEIDRVRSTLSLEQLHIAARLLGLRCECYEPDTSPPMDWGPGPMVNPIPHHCECPFAPFELPDPEKTPTAYAFFMNERDMLMSEINGHD